MFLPKLYPNSLTINTWIQFNTILAMLWIESIHNFFLQIRVGTQALSLCYFLWRQTPMGKNSSKELLSEAQRLYFVNSLSKACETVATICLVFITLLHKQIIQKSLKFQLLKIKYLCVKGLIGFPFLVHIIRIGSSPLAWHSIVTCCPNFAVKFLAAMSNVTGSKMWNEW